MKSVARAFLRYVMVLTLLLSFGVPAASGVGAEDYVVFRVDACSSGSEYAFFLTEQGADVDSMSGSGLYYIDQLRANASEMLVAVLLPGFSACDAYAGGDFSNGAASPRRLGTYIASRTPEQLIEIEESAFEGSDFTHMILGNGVETIGPRAFANCESLAYVFVPDSVQTIAEDAFSGCGELVIGCFSGTAAESYANQNGIPCRTLG